MDNSKMAGVVACAGSVCEDPPHGQVEAVCEDGSWVASVAADDERERMFGDGIAREFSSRHVYPRVLNEEVSDGGEGVV